MILHTDSVPVIHHHIGSVLVTLPIVVVAEVVGYCFDNSFGIHLLHIAGFLVVAAAVGFVGFADHIPVGSDCNSFGNHHIDSLHIAVAAAVVAVDCHTVAAVPDRNSFGIHHIDCYHIVGFVGRSNLLAAPWNNGSITADGTSVQSGAMFQSTERQQSFCTLIKASQILGAYLLLTQGDCFLDMAAG